MPIRVLVVDDSLFMRAAVKRILERDQRFEVVGEAKDGRDAVDKVLALKPDCCTMDFNMPRMDGAAAVREIMRQRPTPVVMLSAHTREGARETFEALAAGAVDFVAKPSGEVSAELLKVETLLVTKLAAAVQSAPRSLDSAPRAPAAAPRLTAPMPTATIGPRVVIIGISTGGPAALGRLVPRLPAETSHALVVVQHLPAGFTAALAERLDGLSAVRVREADAGDHPSAGVVLIAPGDRHLSFATDGSVVLEDGPEVNGVRPSADVTLLSAARVFGRRCVAVIMTGMGKDGADGARAVKAAGGATLAQDKASCVVWGMPRAAVETGCIDKEVPLDDLADAIRRA
jgi:two-component system chemotaxis response regulator CheB